MNGARPAAASSRVDSTGVAKASVPSRRGSPRFMPASQSAKAAPTGPTPSATMAAQAADPGATQAPVAPCSAAASAAVAPQNPATAPDGTVLFQADLGNDPKGWKMAGGKWNTQDSAIKQSAENATTTAVTGDPAWTDYTLTLKARKISGKEGFLVLVRATDDNNYVWWNVGGWNNSRTAVQGAYDGERIDVGPSAPVTVEAGRWYDLRVEVAGHHIKTYLDGTPVNDVTEEPVDVRTPVYAGASYDKASGDVVLKVVNMANDSLDAAVQLEGVGAVSPSGKAIVLTGDNLEAQNSIAEPTKIAPREEAVTDAAASFKRTFPPRSFTLLRLHATRE